MGPRLLTNNSCFFIIVLNSSDAGDRIFQHLGVDTMTDDDALAPNVTSASAGKVLAL